MHKKILIPLVLGVVSVLAIFNFVNIDANAAQFLSGGEVRVDQPTSNLYVAGDEVIINTPIQKDLVAAGGRLDITGSVERNAIVAGGQVNINTDRIGASLRVAGGQVNITGIINEDLVVAGGQVNITGATINGDLVVVAGDLKITDSIVNGNFYGSYDKYSGQELSSFVAGQINIQDIKTETKNEVDGKKLAFGFELYSQISAIAGLIFFLFILSRRNRLSIPSIHLDKLFALDFAIAAGVISVTILGCFSAIVFFQIVIPVVLIMASIFTLSWLFLPVYMGNFAKNVFKLRAGTWILVILVYVLLVLLKILIYLVPVFGVLNFFVWLFGMANFGFIIRKLYWAGSVLLEKRQSLTKK
jgi:hypothetical protein